MIIDSHCHLHDPAFEDTRGVVTRATEHGVWGVVAVGCDAETNRRTLEAAATHQKAIWPALGFHPERVELTDQDLTAVESQIAAHHGRLVALGEVGLPWYCLEGASDAAHLMAEGRRRFSRLLELAVRFDPPVTRAIIEAGYLVSVTPEVVYRERDRELVEMVPLESLLIESDGPWPYRGEFEGLVSGPWVVGRVAEEVAKIKHLPVDEAMHQLCANTVQLFDLMWT